MTVVDLAIWLMMCGACFAFGVHRGYEEGMEEGRRSYKEHVCRTCGGYWYRGGVD
jgi:hypothetical protein